MPGEDETHESVPLSQLNDELNESLKRCRDLLKRHRSQLAANDPAESRDEEQSRQA